MENSNKPQEGIFINGKAQAIEILKNLNTDEKRKLLAQIRLRNPTLADELSEQSYSIKSIMSLTDHELRLVAQYTDPNILGVSLKATPINFQRKILTLIDREKAERAYHVMTTKLSDEKTAIAKAHAKFVATAVALAKRNQINL